MLHGAFFCSIKSSSEYRSIFHGNILNLSFIVTYESYDTIKLIYGWLKWKILLFKQERSCICVCDKFFTNHPIHAKMMTSQSVWNRYFFSGRKHLHQLYINGCCKK